MTVLVTYATHSGATLTLAEAIAETLTVAGVTNELVDVNDRPDPASYDAVVLGTGVRIDAAEKPATAWATQHRDVLASKPMAFFTCSGSASDPAKGGKQKAADAFVEKLGFSPMAVKNFPGWVILDKIPVHERLLLKSMRTPTGDFRDLDSVRDWAQELAPLLQRA